MLAACFVWNHFRIFIAFGFGVGQVGQCGSTKRQRGWLFQLDLVKKTKQSDFLMQLSLIVDGVGMNVVVFKSGVPFWKKTQSQIEQPTLVNCICGWMDWILIRKPVLIEHLAVFINTTTSTYLECNC